MVKGYRNKTVGVSRLAFRGWRFAVGVSRLAFRGWRFAVGVSRLAFRGWRFAVGVSRLAVCAVGGLHGWWFARLAVGGLRG